MRIAIPNERDDCERRRFHFRTLTREQQVEAIKRLAAAGAGDETIASATGLSREMVRRLIGEPPTSAERPA